MNVLIWSLAAGLIGLWAIRQCRVVLGVAAGYKAKVLCTGIFGCGRQLSDLHEQVSADSYWMLRPFAVRVDRQAQTVTTSLAWLTWRAIHRAGAGATLLAGRTDAAPLRLTAPAIRTTSDGWLEARSSERLQRIVDRAFDEPVPRRKRRTSAVLVVHDRRIVAERYARPITATTPLPGWSMAKSVLNALLGILVDEGRLSLEARGLLREWQAPDPRSAISLEDLLRMRSGLRFSETYANPWSDVLHMLYDCGDMAAYAAARPLADPPGQVWRYASGTSNILSRLIRETVGDDAYHAWPRHALFDRIGMGSACLEPDAAGTYVCSSYMLATARDWARFGQLWAEDGCAGGRRLLSHDWIRFSTTPTVQSPDGRYGAHWWLKLNPEIGGDTPAAQVIARDAFFAVGHEGQTLTVIPSKRLVVVRLGASIDIDAWDQAGFIASIEDAL